jgi:superfamily I DNA/RNA helicase
VPRRSAICGTQAAGCWAKTWRDHGASNGALDGVHQGYWRDEVTAFIKGSDITDFEDYAARPRTGRRMPLQLAQRREVWRLYEHYRQLLNERKLIDSQDVLLMARDCARHDAADAALLAEYELTGTHTSRPLRGAESAFDAVIVDEAQDLPIVGLQFLHALVGDKPDGLLIVGDGQQSIYPGGGTLAEAGIAVTGRSTVLRHNYRNRELILRHALGVVAADQFADLDPDLHDGIRDVTTLRSGGEVVQVTGGPESQAMAMATHIREVIHDGRARPGEIAVLLPDKYKVRRWLDLLESQRVRPRIRFGQLSQYDGRASDLPMIGTYHRAKGLEFAYVYVPDQVLQLRIKWNVLWLFRLEGERGLARLVAGSG